MQVSGVREHETLVDRVIFAIAHPTSTLDNFQVAFGHHFR